MANIHCGCDDRLDMHRRDLLKLGAKGVALGAFGLSLPSVLFMREAYGITPENPFFDAVLTVFFQGGPSQTDTWDVKPGSQNQVFNTINLGTQDVYNEDFRISDVFSDLANLVQNDPAVSMGVIRSLWHGSRNHGNGQMMTASGWRGQLGNSYPSGAPVMAYYFQGQGLGIPAVMINGNNGNGANDTRGARVPTALQVNAGGNQNSNPVVQALQLPPGVDQARYQRRKTLLDCLNQRFLSTHPDQMAKDFEKATEDAFSVTSQGQAAAAFDLTGKQLLPARNNQHAQRFTLAQELIKAGIPYVSMGIGGNDSHGNNTQTINGNWGQSYDQAVAQMAQNLKGTGKRVLIVSMGDFGRQPSDTRNGRNGRDHWASQAVSFVSVNQPKFKTTAIGDTGPDGNNENNATDRMEPKDLWGFIYRSMGIPLFAPDGRSDIPTPLGRNAPPVERVDNQSTKLMQTFGLV